MPKIAWMLAVMLTVVTAPVLAIGGDNLTPTQESAAWSRWQGRVSFAATEPRWNSGSNDLGSDGLHVGRAKAINSLSVMGDYYFAHSLAGPKSVGGFRATSGLIFGPRSQLSSSQSYMTAVDSFSMGSRRFGPSSSPYAVNAVEDTATLPYLGLGYTGYMGVSGFTGLSGRGAWRFNADLGMVTHGLGTAVNPGRMFGSGQKRLDDSLRDLRLTPLFKLGVSYSF